MALPIQEYALIGDRRTAALVGTNGSIDWLCLPRFDSGACFAALLGTDDHGHWQLRPADHHAVRRRYVGDTSALETTFTTSDGEVTLTAPAGSVAIWLSNTWHRSGPNHTDRERRAILCNYNVSWLRGFADFTSTLADGIAAGLSNDARYLLGYGARAPLTR